jgi:A/G-specific adenine glycosylase
MRKRREKDIWHGLFDFVLIEKNKAEKPESIMADETCRRWFDRSDGFEVSKDYKHVLTHQTIHCRFIQVNANPSFAIAEEGLSFYSRREIADLPKPALITRFLQEQNNL